MKKGYIIQQIDKDGINPKWHDYARLKPFSILADAKKELAKLTETSYYGYRIVRWYNTN